MGVEVVKSELAKGSTEAGTEESSSLLHEVENGTMHQGSGLSEPIKFGSHGMDEPVNREGNKVPGANFPKDAVDEWPEPKQIHSFYFIKYRSYDDPKLKVKLEQADKEIQKKTQARSQILEKIRAKRSDRADVIAQIRPLNAENKQFWTIVDEKRKEMEPFQQALGKLRNSNTTSREKGAGLCSSEEELNDLIKSLQYRIQHESIPLSEEKQLLREIKQLEGTREKVIANDAVRAKIQDSLGEKEVIQDQVKLMGMDLDGVRKEHQLVKAKIKQLSDKKEAIEKEIESLEAELRDITEKREKAYEGFQELKKQREEGNTCFYQNRALLNKAREFAAKKDIEALREFGNMEVEQFLSLWNNSKAFRDDYERRILSSLDNRQLSRDGRMRNPDEKPPVLQDTPNFSETDRVTKTNVKRPKEDSFSSPQPDASLVEKVQKEAKIKPQKEAKNKPTDSATNLESIDFEERVSEKLQKDSQSLPDKVDEVKLKEMRRQEEIAKATQALERKKKLAEKAAVKAAIKAQKEAEKKLKEREKKAKKKAAASATAPEPEKQASEVDAEVVDEPEKAEENIVAPVPSKSKDRKENAIRYRNRSKGTDSRPRTLLKRKKSTSNYWVWAAPAALSVLMLLVIGYKYFL